MSEKKVVSRNIALALGIAFILALASLAGFYYGSSSIVSSKDATIATLNSQIQDKTLQIQNQTSQIQNQTIQIGALNDRIAVLQNLTVSDQATIDELESQVALLENLTNSNDSQAGTILALRNQISALNSQIADLTTQLNAMHTLVNPNVTPVWINSSIINFNDSAAWVNQAGALYTQIANASIRAGESLSIPGLNLVPGNAYFVSMSLFMNATSNATATCYFDVNSDPNMTHYYTGYLYGNALNPTTSVFQLENDPRIFDNGQLTGAQGIIFDGILEIDPMGYARMTLYYDAYANVANNLENGIYGWMYNYAPVNSINRIDLNSTMPFTGSVSIFGIAS
jgi:hypothetical protein